MKGILNSLKKKKSYAVSRATFCEWNKINERVSVNEMAVRTLETRGLGMYRSFVKWLRNKTIRDVKAFNKEAARTIKLWLWSLAEKEQSEELTIIQKRNWSFGIVSWLRTAQFQVQFPWQVKYFFASYSMATRFSFPRGEMVKEWRWPLISSQFRGWECVELYSTPPYITSWLLQG